MFGKFSTPGPSCSKGDLRKSRLRVNQGSCFSRGKEILVLIFKWPFESNQSQNAEQKGLTGIYVTWLDDQTINWH